MKCVLILGQEYEAAFRIMVAKGKIQYLMGVENFKSCNFSCQGVIQTDMLDIRIDRKNILGASASYIRNYVSARYLKGV